DRTSRHAPRHWRPNFRMKRIMGILVIVLILYALLLSSDRSARSAATHLNMAGRLAFYGILTLGVGMLITTGGIDLSIGSVCCLGAISLALLIQGGMPSVLAVAIVLVGATTIGLLHGLLVTRLGLQPFIVTLCGLFIYRGLATWLAMPDPVAPLRML